MPHSRVTVRVARTASMVFDCLAGHAWTNEPAWEPEVVDVRPLDGGPIRLGGRVAMTRRDRGKTLQTTYEITSLEPPRHVAARHLYGPMAFAIDFRVEPVGEAASDVTVDVAIGLRGPMRVLTPLFALVGPRRNAAIARRMARAIEVATEPAISAATAEAARTAPLASRPG